VKRPIREMKVTVDHELDAAPSWRESFFFFAGAVLEIAKALHRIADEMERRSS
jgi:hypothetical protein